MRASLRAAWRDFEEPGPLLESLLHDGSEADPRFQSDGGHDGEWEATVDYDSWLGAGGTMRTTVRAGGRHATLTRTLPLSPDFGSTSVRSLRTAEGGVTTQADFNATILPIERLSIGASVDLGAIDSRYFSNADDGARTLDAQGDGRRVATSAFAHLATARTGALDARSSESTTSMTHFR
jgi:hypothetical protein